MPSVVAIIPARYQASRLPGKVLLDIAGRPMIEHVYERVSRAEGLDRVLVATDDDRIAAAVRGFGGEVAMTRTDHASGTDRLAEVAAGLTCDIVINVQGDEPMIAPESLGIALAPLLAEPELPMSTLREALTDQDEIDDPNNVKVVVDQADHALYFSRHAIPYRRNEVGEAIWWRHIGLYAYRREFLLHYTSWRPTVLERVEGLEQLRVLEHGYRIKAPLSPYPAVGVDTPADLERVRALLGAQA